MDKKNRKWTLWGYYLSVNGRVLEDYMGELPTCWDVLKECQPNNLFIWAYSPYTDELGSLGIIFYDQRKRHFGGKGITGGYIQLLSPTKIRWKLDGKKEFGMRQKVMNLLVTQEGDQLAFLSQMTLL